MKWTPRPSDIAWTENLVKMIKDGGTWAQPASGASFTFYHAQKEFTVQDHMTFNRDMVARTRKVLGIMGWTERKEWIKPSPN